MSVSAPLSHLRAFAAAILCAILVAAGVLLTAPSAHAADQGAGFGTWAPLSASGWHGSMMVGGIQTYCILPGLPLPVGGSVDHGVTSTAAGLSPQQLVGINQLVTKYGQTSDPVQAAAVGWAVKAIANRAETLHAWGYPGDSLAEAVRWTFSRLAPAHAAAVAGLAESFYAEGMSTPVISGETRIALTTDSSDARRGTVRFEAAGAGTVNLTNAVFSDTRITTLTHAIPGTAYAITAVPPADDGAPYSVSARVEGSAGFAPAVRYITTAGGQDTAGPGGPVQYAAETTDASPRPVVFAPILSTQVVEPQFDAGPFIDDVTLTAGEGVWPLAENEMFVTIRATAHVYRTETRIGETSEIPAEATLIGDLGLMSDPSRGPGVYRVTSNWELPGPGVYTAVWQINAAAQEAIVAPHLPPGYAWAENFGIISQQITIQAPPPQPERTPPPGQMPSAPPVAPPTLGTAPALAATGPDATTWRLGGLGAIAVILGCAFLAHAAQQRRRSARS